MKKQSGPGAVKIKQCRGPELGVVGRRKVIHVFNGCSSSIKEINRLISKKMYVLLFDVFNSLSQTGLLK